MLCGLINSTTQGVPNVQQVLTVTSAGYLGKGVSMLHENGAQVIPLLCGTSIPMSAAVPQHTQSSQGHETKHVTRQWVSEGQA